MNLKTPELLLGMLALITLPCCGIFAQQPGEQLFNDEVLHIIHFDNVDNSELFDPDNKNVFFRVDALIDGIAMDSIGLAAKGHISWNHPNNKKPFKIKLNRYTPGKQFDGIKEFTLHNCYQDPSMMREKLAYDISERLGLYTVRTAFARVFIDNEYWGLYLMVEAKDELYDIRFDQRGADAVESSEDGNLCYYGPDWAYYTDTTTNTGRYILENGNHSTTWPRFITLLNVMENTSAGQYMFVVPSYIDIDDFFAYQAMNVFLMNFDSYIDDTGNQIYMYDKDAEVWRVIPWDFNAAFGLWKADQFSPDTYPMIPGVMDYGCVASRMDDVPELRNFYLDAMCRFITDVVDTTWLMSRIDLLKNLIGAAVDADQRKAFSDNDFEETTEYGYFDFPTGHIAGLKTFVKERYALVSQSLLDEGFPCNSGVKPASPHSILKIYPTPTDGIIQISNLTMPENELVLILFDNLGRIVKKMSPSAGKISIKELNNGLYNIRVFYHDNMILSQKIIKAF